MKIPIFVREMGAVMGGDLLLETLKSLTSDLAAKGPSFVGNRIKSSIPKRRGEVTAFIVGGLLDGSPEGTQASATLILHQRLWQECQSRPYGSGEPYEHGLENRRVKAIEDLYEAFDPPEPIQLPELRSGTGAQKINEELLREYHRQRDARDEVARERAEARIACFKQLGLMSFEERDAFLEMPVDDSIRQFVKLFTTGVSNLGRAGWNVVDMTAGIAARPGGFLDGLVNQLEDYAYRADPIEGEVVDGPEIERGAR